MSEILIPFSRRHFLALAGIPVLAAMAACAEQKPSQSALSAEHVEFFSNGAVLSTESRLQIRAYPERLNTLVTEPNGGLKLPEDYVIVTIISPLLPSQITQDKAMKEIPQSLEGKIQSRFPKQLTSRKYSVAFLLSQDAVENSMRSFTSKEPAKTKTSKDLNKEEMFKSFSNQLSVGWFFTVREQYAAENRMPKPPRQIPSRIAELIVNAPPFEVVGMAEGARFEG